jgi:transposase-like protein
MRERGSEAWAKWRGLVAEQGQSGQGVAAFCRERGVPASQMFSWKRRLREAEAPRFVEVAVNAAPETAAARGAGSSAIEVRLSRGRSLMVEPGFDAHHLRALLAVLEAEA